MANTVSVSHNLFTSAIESAIDLFKAIRKRYETHRNIQITMKELSKLTDRELNDMGIARGDIWAVAHGDTSHRANDSWNVKVNDNLKGSV